MMRFLAVQNNTPENMLCVVVSLAIVAFLMVFLINYFLVIKPVSDTLNSDNRNAGIDLSIHYEYYLNPNILVINVQNISPEKAPVDVFRCLLQVSEVLKDRKFEFIHLNSKGNEKFYLQGEYFFEF